jgi:PAS domain-containing protein
MVPPALLKRLEPVMSAVPSDLWIETDHNGVIVGWAAGALRLTGYSARSMYGLLLKIMFMEDSPGGGEFGRGMMVHPDERQGLIRSRDDRATRVRYRSEPAPHSSDMSRIITRWTFEPI